MYHHGGNTSLKLLYLGSFCFEPLLVLRHAGTEANSPSPAPSAWLSLHALTPQREIPSHPSGTAVRTTQGVPQLLEPWNWVVLISSCP